MRAIIAFFCFVNQLVANAGVRSPARASVIYRVNLIGLGSVGSANTHAIVSTVAFLSYVIDGNYCRHEIPFGLMWCNEGFRCYLV